MSILDKIPFYKELVKILKKNSKDGKYKKTKVSSLEEHFNELREKYT